MSSSTERKPKQILQTAAAWIPQAPCGDLPPLDETVEALVTCADNLLKRMPWLVALAYALDLPYHVFDTEDLPESALEWDMKALSRQHFFTTVDVPLDPGNIVLSCILLVGIFRSGACVHEVYKGHNDVGIYFLSPSKQH